MARTKKEAGSEFLKGVLALIPEDKRAAIQAVLEADPLVEALGSPLVEYETKAEQAIAEAAKKEQLTLGYKANLDKWYTDTQGTFAATRKELEEAAKKAAAQGDPSDPNAPPKLPANLVTKEDLSKQVADMLAASERGAVGAMAYFNQLGLAHYNEFKEVLDLPALIRNSEAAGKRVNEFYDDSVKARRQEAFAQREKEREAQIRKDEREKVRAELSKQQGHRAFPIPGIVSEEPTTLVGLKAGNGKDATPEYGVKAALDEFFSKGQNIS